MVAAPEPTSREPALNNIAQALRTAFDSGTTRPLAWRMTQLRGIQHMLVQHERHFADALKADLGRSHFETLVSLAPAKTEAEHAIAHVERWSKIKRVGTP